MGFSRMISSAVDSAGGAAPKSLGDLFKEKFPIATGVGSALGIGGNAPTDPGIAMNTVQPDLLTTNAKPKTGSGLDILKAFFA